MKYEQLFNQRSAIYLTDSYKFSHFLQLPENTQFIHLYLESRGGEYDRLVFSGLQYYLERYLTARVTQADVEAVARKAKLHGVEFNKEGWERIVNVHDGYLPVVIKALPEGYVVAPKNVMMTIENTDPELPWISSYLETLILKVWYPITVASKSKAVKKIIQRYHEMTMDNMDALNFSYHNFGDRGSSSTETAEIGGMAHLTQFLGTDNFSSLFLVEHFYDEECAGFSIAASEHSTVTAEGAGQEGEKRMFERYLERSKDRGAKMIACVMDSYDLYEAVEFVTTELKEKIQSPEYPKWIIRPDSGNPIDVLPKVLSIMEKNNVAYTINEKGYKVFDKFGIIWGDGITPLNINNILDLMKLLGYAAGNFAFGSGGDIMQKVDRDTCKFAIKCSASMIDGTYRDVFKDPITDPGKTSKKGRQTLVAWEKIGWHADKISDVQTIRVEQFDENLHHELLEEVFRDGQIVKRYNWNEIKQRAAE